MMHFYIIILLFRFAFVVIAENMAYLKTINTQKFWHCVDFVAACFGHRLDILALRNSRRTFVRV